MNLDDKEKILQIPIAADLIHTNESFGALHDAYEALLAENRALQIAVVGYAWLKARHEWQPIETAPKDGKSIVLWDSPNRAIGYWVGDGWTIEVKLFAGTSLSYERVASKWYSPTHWMHLPEPPEAGEV